MSQGHARKLEKIAAAYHRGVKDRREGKPKQPPKDRYERLAYINGYHDRRG